MKKKFTATGLCLAAALTAGLALSACGTDGNALSAKEAYAIGAVSTVKLMGSRLSPQAINTFAAVGTAADSDGSQTAQDKVKAQAEKFNEYFEALDSFLGDDLVSAETTANTNEAYPYETKMTIEGKGFNGETVEYVMYYTETLEKSKVDEKDGETENKYSLTGVMVLDGADYFLEGMREEETDKNETESELKIRAYADKNDKATYVEMKQEASAETKNNKTENEMEYVYSVYENGKLIEETAVEFETENKNGKEKTEYELEFRSGAGKGKYEIKREIKNGVTEIKVEYKIDGDQGEFRIREKTDGNGNKYYEYTFSDNSTKVI